MKAMLLAVSLVCAGALIGPGNAHATGAPGTMPAFYDGQLFTINLQELSSTAEQSQLAHNGSINNIFMSDAGLPGGQMFTSVLDAIQGDGFNPIWQEVQITFNAGFVPYQLTSDTQIDSLRDAGVITLTNTGEVYRCSVIGAKNLRGRNSASPTAVRRALSTTWGNLRRAFTP